MTMYKPVNKSDVPVMALSESGQDMMLWTLVGAIEYKRDDSESLATHLEKLAIFIRKHT